MVDAATTLHSLVGRTIVAAAIVDEELTIVLDDGREIDLFEDEDGDLSMRVVGMEAQ